MEFFESGTMPVLAAPRQLGTTNNNLLRQATDRSSNFTSSIFLTSCNRSAHKCFLFM